MAKHTTYPTQDDETLRREIDQQFRLAKRYLDPVHQRMNDQEELYRSYIDKNNYPHGARVFDPRTFRIIETIVPRMVANEPAGSFYPVEDGDFATAQILNALVKYDWRRAEMFPKLVMFAKSMLIFGTAFGRIHWDFRERDRTRMVPKKFGDRTEWTPKHTEKTKVTEFDGPNFEVLNIYDCFPDPNATDLANMRWFIYRTFKTLKELKAEDETRGGNYYKNLGELETRINEKKEAGLAGRAYPENLQYREHRRMMLATEEYHGQDESNPELVVLKRFTRDGWVDYLPEHNLIIREIENPYFHGELPLVYCADYPYPGELYGMGEIEPIDRIQRAINAVLNQRLDNVQLTLRTMWKVKKNADVDMHTLVSAPGNIITTGDMAAVEPIQVPDVTGATFQQTIGYLTSALQNGSGVTDYTVGVGNNQTVANDTATGTRLIQQEANAQFKLKIQLFTHNVIQKIANQWKDLRIQYTTDQQLLRIVGKEQVENLRDNTTLSQTDMQGNPIVPGDMGTQAKMQITGDGSFAFLTLLPDDIQPAIVGDYDFIAQVAYDQLSDPIAMQQNFFLALDRVTNPNWIQGLQLQNKQMNFAGLTQKVFEKLNMGLEDKDIVVDAPPPPPQIDPQTGQPLQQPPQQGQPLGPQDISAMLEPQQNPLVNPLEQGGVPPNGGAATQPGAAAVPQRPA